MKILKTVLTLVLTLIMIMGIMAPAMAEETGDAPKNVIIMIADGTGFNGYLAGDYYMHGEAGKQIFEQDDWVKLACSTYSLGTEKTTDDMQSYYDPNKMWTDFLTFQNFATDSSASATAICTGVKTYDYAIGVNQDKIALSGLVAEFESLGKATGAITSVPISHATPAAFIAHNPNRNDYDGISKEAIWEGTCEVIMGGGNPEYDDAGLKLETPKYTYIGEETWTKLMSGDVTGADGNGDGKVDAWTFIQEKADFEAIAAGENVPDRLLGVATVGSTLQCYRAGLGMPITTPFATDMNSNVPDLVTMSSAALNVLDKDEDGFFLMIEGGATDWANHSAKSAVFIEEYTDFVKSIEAVCNWVEKNSSWNETLLIVTADHETGYITNTKGEYGVVGNNGKGIMPTMAYNSGGHSNQLVPFFAKGAGADIYKTFANENDPYFADWYGSTFGVNGDYIDNTEISAGIRTMLGIQVPDDGYTAPVITKPAVPTKSKVTIDGISATFEAYTISGNNYFKLRDLAKVISGSTKQFEVTWDADKNAINLETEKAYTSVGGEPAPGDNTNKTATLSTSTVYINGVKANLTAYNIGGNNYFKLRDIGKALNFGVDWDAEANTISIDTTIGYKA